MVVKKITTIILGAIVSLPLFVHSNGYAADILPAWTDQIKVIPSISIKEAYNDNVYFTKTDRKSDWVSTITPGLELVSKTERMDAGVSARFNGIYYIDQHELNAVDQFYSGRLHYSLTENLSLGASAGFTRDSQSTREIDTTGLIFSTAVIRERQNFGFTGDWRINETTAASMTYNYGNDQYDQSAYSDLKSHTVGLNFVTDLNDTTKGNINFGYSYSDQQAGNTTDNYSGTIGINKNFSQIWSVLINAGAVYTHSSFNGLTGEQTNQAWNPMGSITITGKYEKTTGSLTLSRSVSSLSGSTGSANRTLLGLSLNRKFTYELSGNFTANYIINKSDPGDFSSTGIDQNTFTVSLGPQYNFNKDIFLMASYTYQRIDYGQTNTYADQHMAMLTLNIQHTFFE